MSNNIFKPLNMGKFLTTLLNGGSNGENRIMQEDTVEKMLSRQYTPIVNDAITVFLEGLGYTNKTIKATHTYSPEDLKSMWSHRSAAAIAGLGAFGANRLLITEKGSGGRFCTVITSANLKANTDPIENKCLYIKNGSCGLCFKICPVDALKPESMDKFRCQDELNKNEKNLKENTNLQSVDICGKCISICPVAYL